MKYFHPDIQQQLDKAKKERHLYVVIVDVNHNTWGINTSSEEMWEKSIQSLQDLMPDECFVDEPLHAEVPAYDVNQRVLSAIRAEREYQLDKYGRDKMQPMTGYFAILRAELAEAEDGWLKNKTGRNSCLGELVQVAAVAIAALEQYNEYFEQEDIPMKDANGNFSR